MAGTDLTAARVRELLNYDPDTGVFTWKVSRKGVKHIGVAAGHKDSGLGYIVIRIDRVKYYAHRLAWVYVTGAMPTDTVDHIDGNRANNAWANLRDVSRLINMQNMRGPCGKNTASGLLGAHKKRGRWSSKLRVDGRLLDLGTFATAQEAHEAYIAAKRIHHEGCTI